MMWEGLGISGGTAIIVLIAVYFVVKRAVRNGITEAYEKIAGKKADHDLDEILEKEAEEWGKETLQQIPIDPVVERSGRLEWIA